MPGEVRHQNLRLAAHVEHLDRAVRGAGSDALQGGGEGTEGRSVKSSLLLDLFGDESLGMTGDDLGTCCAVLTVPIGFGSTQTTAPSPNPHTLP